MSREGTNITKSFSLCVCLESFFIYRRQTMTGERHAAIHEAAGSTRAAIKSSTHENLKRRVSSRPVLMAENFTVDCGLQSGEFVRLFQPKMSKARKKYF